MQYNTMQYNFYLYRKGFTEHKAWKGLLQQKLKLGAVLS